MLFLNGVKIVYVEFYLNFLFCYGVSLIFFLIKFIWNCFLIKFDKFIFGLVVMFVVLFGFVCLIFLNFCFVYNNNYDLIFYLWKGRIKDE